MGSRARLSRTFLGIAVAVVAMLGSGSPTAVEHGDSDAAVARPAPPATSGGGVRIGGLRAVIDPVTRERVPEPPPEPLREEWIESLSQSAAGLTVVQRPDGSKHLDLRGRFQCGTLVRVGPGGVEQHCVSSPAQADAVSRSGQAPAAATLEK